MKKGIQYSHYCGTELQEIVCGVHEIQEIVKEINAKIEFFEDSKQEVINWGNYVKDMAQKLRDKIAELDKLNKMDY